MIFRLKYGIIKGMSEATDRQFFEKCARRKQGLPCCGTDHMTEKAKISRAERGKKVQVKVEETLPHPIPVHPRDRVFESVSSSGTSWVSETAINPMITTMLQRTDISNPSRRELEKAAKKTRVVTPKRPDCPLIGVKPR